MLRAPLALRAACARILETCHERLNDLPAFYPACTHITLCGFGTGTPTAAVQDLAAAWSRDVAPVSLTIARVTARPSPTQILVVETVGNDALFSAVMNLRRRADAEGLRVSTPAPAENRTFAMSLVYGGRLDAASWSDLVAFAETAATPPVSGIVEAADVAVFDGGHEHSGGRYPLLGTS